MQIFEQFNVSEGFGLAEVNLNYTLKDYLEQKQVINGINVKLIEERFIGQLMICYSVVLNEQIRDQKALINGCVNAKSLLQ